MPLLDITKPDVISFLLENYEKESRIRTRWVALHAEKFKKAATFHGKVNNYTTKDISEAVLVAGMATTTRDHIVSDRNRMKAPIADYLLAKIDKEREVQSPMKEVEEHLKKKFHRSRKEYLKLRNKLAPEDKYNFIETINWKYGWKLEESELQMKGPAYGRVLYLYRDMYTRVGPQPDPEHYNSAHSYQGVCIGF